MRQQIDPVGRRRGIGRAARSGDERRQPIHADRHLTGGASLRQPRRPRDDRRDAQATLEQLRLPAGERPRVGEALAAVVAREDDDRVRRQAVRVKRLEDAADLRVHCLDHALIGLLRPAVVVGQTG